MYHDTHALKPDADPAATIARRPASETRCGVPRGTCAFYDATSDHARVTCRRCRALIARTPRGVTLPRAVRVTAALRDLVTAASVYSDLSAGPGAPALARARALLQEVQP
jgi:hypothetical protein